MLARLAGHGATAFTELAQTLDTTQAVLSVQLKRLEDAGYVRLDRGFLGRKPRTTVLLTPVGRSAYETHLDTLLKLAGDAG